MRVVLDANTYVSALISGKGNPGQIIRKWLSGEFEVLLSPAILDEVLRVTGYSRVQKKYRQVKDNRLEFVELLSKQGIVIEPPNTLNVVKDDESDNRYIECAVAGGAQYLVTGDEHLLALAEYQGIAILSPAAFMLLPELL